MISDSYTPNKSIVITKITGNQLDQRIKYINKKGTFLSREQCKTCNYLGKVQVGIGYAFDVSCDRENGFWKKCNGVTDKVCKHYKIKEKL